MSDIKQLFFNYLALLTGNGAEDSFKKDVLFIIAFLALSYLIIAGAAF